VKYKDRKESQVRDRRQKILLQDRLANNGLLITSCTALFISIAIYSFSDKSSFKDQLYSIAASLIASTIFAWVFNFFANKEFVRLIKEEISDEGCIIASNVIDEISHFYSSYIPSSVYMPTSGVDIDFNRDLEKDLRESNVYLFQGVSAKYVSARVKHSNHNISVLKTIILNPLDIRSISIRANDRLKNPKYRDQSNVSDEIKNEIYMSVIALFDCRMTCTVEIAYCLGTSVARLEIFDEALYVSLYHTDKAQLREFPETLRYSKKSMQYNLHRMDSFREFDVAERKVTFDRETKEDELVKHLKEIGMNPVNAHIIMKYRERHKAFSDKFIADSMMGRH
jgi:hypothetical protein